MTSIYWGLFYFGARYRKYKIIFNTMVLRLHDQQKLLVHNLDAQTSHNSEALSSERVHTCF